MSGLWMDLGTQKFPCSDLSSPGKRIGTGTIPLVTITKNKSFHTTGKFCVIMESAGLNRPFLPLPQTASWLWTNSGASVSLLSSKFFPALIFFDSKKAMFWVSSNAPTCLLI